MFALWTNVHITTAFQHLRFQFGLKSYKPAHKPRLTPHMKSKRLAFAKEHEAWTSEDWSKGMFSDECTLQKFVLRKKRWKACGEKF